MGGSHPCPERGGFSLGWSDRQARGSCSPWSPPLCWDHLRPAVTGVLLFWAPPFRQRLDLEDEPWDPNHGDGSPSLWERVQSGQVAAPLLWSEVVTRLGQGLQTGLDPHVCGLLAQRARSPRSQDGQPGSLWERGRPPSRPPPGCPQSPVVMWLFLFKSHPSREDTGPALSMAALTPHFNPITL